MRQRICAPADCPEGQALEFELDLGQGPEPCFLLHWQGRWLAYRNQCPHQGLTLNWQPGHFLSADGAWLECINHGALFQIEDGHCIYGPCRGQRLSALALEVDEAGVWVCFETLSPRSLS